jgi:hypothetical protein
VTFTLEGRSGAKLDATCDCDINEKLRPRLKAVKKGDTVKVQGKGMASKFDPAIYLHDCRLLK